MDMMFYQRINGGCLLFVVRRLENIPLLDNMLKYAAIVIGEYAAIGKYRDFYHVLPI